MRESVRPAQGDASWFLQDRLGLWIHWGIYSLAARHEWVKNRECLTEEAYKKYFCHFDPDLYEPCKWARDAREAGIKYFCITTKHHDGFCLWDSKHTDYKAPNTPCGRDVLRPMVEAFRAEGLKVGFYHSLLDWHHPEFPVDRYHPMRDNAAFREATKDRDVSKYADYLHAQVRELLTEFGRIDYIFFDYSYPGADGKGRDDWRSADLIKMVRHLQPHIMVNDRLDLVDTDDGWDFRTPEQVAMRDPFEMDGRPVLWENGWTFSGSWGYHRDQATWKNVKQLLVLLIDTVSKDGNLLLNVGPTARGEFDQRALDRFAGIGKWMRRHSRSIYGCGPAPAGFPTPQDCRLTYNEKLNRLYVHLLDWPIDELHLDGFAGKVDYAQLLNDGSEVFPKVRGEWQELGDVRPGSLSLEMPIIQPDVTIPVIELFLK